MADPIYSAGVTAGIEAAVAFLDGRASMAREMGRGGEATGLDGARLALARLAGGDPDMTPMTDDVPAVLVQSLFEPWDDLDGSLARLQEATRKGPLADLVAEVIARREALRCPLYAVMRTAQGREG